MIDYQVEVWDWHRQGWYLIKAFQHTNSITQNERLNLAQALVDSLARRHLGLTFRLNQVLN
ncbi:hypothetical protein [Spirosoma pollinicola]|uniref:Uncharacterized protein n=1 Tax=Spirosoma pollinicola TaxID=2057025 RepID=A0A2K8Z0U7_9BACT|nr:hypothetical protein [Spirosoma pollinicola]AUD03513.1 hypothetical protein CWM47_17760 [Spirosoma pollinicola]